MPEAATIENAPAQATLPAQVAVNSPEITPATLAARSAAPARPARPGSARARMEAELDKVGGVKAKEQSPAQTAPTAKAGSPQEAAEPPENGEAASPPEPRAAEETPAQAQPAKTEDGKPGKVSPWKLVDQHKARSAALEQENISLKGEVETLRKSNIKPEQLQALEKRVQEMTEDLRFFNAEKYDPEILKANADYESAWKRALADLSEITVTDPTTGQSVPLNGETMLELVNMSLGNARDVADKVFGKFADDVMAHRKAIRTLFDQKAAKVEELKKTGAQRDQQRKQAFDSTMKALNETVQKDYNEANTAAAADPQHGEYFKPREGDADWNTRLESGFKMVDAAYAENALDPRLTPDQRKAVVQRHAAVRNRAAAFGPLRFRLQKVERQLAEALKELNSYKASAPNAGGRTASNGAGKGHARAMDAMLSDLDKLAQK